MYAGAMSVFVCMQKLIYGLILCLSSHFHILIVTCSWLTVIIPKMIAYRWKLYTHHSNNATLFVLSAWFNWVRMLNDIIVACSAFNLILLVMHKVTSITCLYVSFLSLTLAFNVVLFTNRPHRWAHFPIQLIVQDSSLCIYNRKYKGI